MNVPPELYTTIIAAIFTGLGGLVTAIGAALINYQRSKQQVKRDELNTVREQVAFLDTRLKRNEDDICALQDENDLLRKKYNDVSAELAGAKQRVTNLESQLVMMTQDRDRVQRQLDVANARILELEHQLSELQKSNTTA